MAQKSPKLQLSETLLPARMSLDIKALSDVRFATLDFPYARALDHFVSMLKVHYQRKYDKVFDQYPPYRQLNLAIMACCPVLVHAFEKIVDDRRCMVAINRLAREPKTNAIIDNGDQFPDILSLRDLIETWLDHWLENTRLKELVDQVMRRERETLFAALDTPETQWQTDITLAELLKSLSEDDALGYDAIPAIIMALLHGQKTVLTEGSAPVEITWRKAHDGGKDGLHLVSQPFNPHYHPRPTRQNGYSEGEEYDGYYVYRLDVGLETQVGRIDDKGQLNPWIFLKVGMRRYADEAFKKDEVDRDLSVLLGFNRDKIVPAGKRDKFAGYPHDTTLIALQIDTRAKVWSDNLAKLLSAYGLTTLVEAEQLLANPAKYGNMDQRTDFKGNEYYLIHAEGRTWIDPDRNGKGKGHNHPLDVGLSLKERTEIVQRVLEILPDVLIPDIPFERDIQAPKGQNVPLTLRDYEFFKPKSSDTPEKATERLKHTTDAIYRAVKAAGKEKADLALIYADPQFMQAVKAKLAKMFPGCNTGDDPFLRLVEVKVSPTMHDPLDRGALDYFAKDRASDFRQQWNTQMQKARDEKLGEWGKDLAKIEWRADAHRLALIESYHDHAGFKAQDESQEIKGVIREACSAVGIASQFVIHFNVGEDGKISHPANEGRLENAILDLMLRNTGAIYGEPSNLYARVAGLPATVTNLDVVTFWHVQTRSALNKNIQLKPVIAVRLRANGQTEFITPGMTRWKPYASGSYTLGAMFAKLRPNIRSGKTERTLVGLSNTEIMNFVREVLRDRLDAPTIAVIPADWWRGMSKKDIPRWRQLGNKRLFTSRDVLDFSHLPGGETIKRNNSRYANLLAVIRLRSGSETPQYTAGTATWNAAQQTDDPEALSGYVDCTVTEPLHYFSLAGRSEMQKEQFKDGTKDGYKDGYKDNMPYEYAYKHQQLVELLPFFVRADFRSEEGFKILCRCVHFLRVSPAFIKGNILLPYPMHLAKGLLDDLRCIVDAD